MPGPVKRRRVKKTKSNTAWYIALGGTALVLGVFLYIVIHFGGPNGVIEQKKKEEQRKAQDELRKKRQEEEAERRKKYAKADPGKIKITDDGLVSKDILVEGTGPQAQKGQRVSVHYTGTLNDGTKFDSSVDRGQPFEFTIGSGVIQGWSLGVATMKVGEKSRFVIDSKYGYGERGAGRDIPGGATLIFEIELLKILD